MGNEAHNIPSGVYEGLSKKFSDKIRALNPKLESVFGIFRDQALAALSSTPFPNGSEEHWRYTRPEQFPFERLNDQSAAQFQIGLMDGSLSPSIKGVEFSDFSSSSGKLEPFIPLIADSTDAVGALQLGTTTAAAMLTIKAGAHIANPIVLREILSGVAASTILFIRIEKGAEVTIINELNRYDGFHSTRVELLIEKDARAKYVAVQNFTSTAHHLSRVRAHLFENSYFQGAFAALGGKVSRTYIDMIMHASRAEAEAMALFLVDGHRHVDFHTTQRHLAPNCRSELYCKGVLKDHAHSVYHGIIEVAPHAQKTDAYQKNRNLLLSAKARADSIPKLEIQANDVKCSHGASVSQVGEEELFYLMSRGMDCVTAERLLVEGFFEDLLARIKNEALHDYVYNQVMERL